MEGDDEPTFRTLGVAALQVLNGLTCEHQPQQRERHEHGSDEGQQQKHQDRAGKDVDDEMHVVSP